MKQHYDYESFVISDNTMGLIMIFICQYYSSTLSFSNIPPAVHTKWHSSKSHAIAFLSALILSSCLRNPACKFIYEDLINSTVYFNMQCSCKNPPQLKYASKQPNLSKQAAFLCARWLETAWNYKWAGGLGFEQSNYYLFILEADLRVHVLILMAHLF